MNVEQARFNMIEQQIRPWDVLDKGILDLLAVVKREDFVPEGQRALAFTDSEIPLPEGQCMLAPRVEARLLQEAHLQRHERALEIGTGSGYMAALLSHRAQSVISFECRPVLAQYAQDRLRRARVFNVNLRSGDGSAGAAAEAPFDAILLSGSVASVPQALLDQLRVGGRLLAIVGFEPVMRAQRITRLSEASFQTTTLFDTVATRLQGFAEPQAFKF